MAMYGAFKRSAKVFCVPQKSGHPGCRTGAVPGTLVHHCLEFSQLHCVCQAGRINTWFVMLILPPHDVPGNMGVLDCS